MTALMRLPAPVRLALPLSLMFLAACGSHSPGANNSAPGTPGQPTANPPVVQTPAPTPTTPVAPDPGGGGAQAKSRYSVASSDGGSGDGCIVLRSTQTGNLVTRDGAGYNANAVDIADAEAFLLKPSALGSYLIYNRSRELVTGDAGIGNVTLDAASPAAVWTLLASGDNTAYPPTPEFNREPTPAEIAAYRDFVDPMLDSEDWTFDNAASGQRLAVDGSGAVVTAAAANNTSERFIIESVTGCAEFPEASSNTVGESFSGTTADGRVLGMADVHVHISSTTFLGEAQWGSPFHPFGVTHALDDCDEYHGPNGMLDVVGAAFTQDFDGHDVTGWPTFPEWPARDSLLHEAIYWKWLERAWQAGLRVIVNDLVDNETLCELQRNVAMDTSIDCNSMNNAGRQAGSMYAMQDYIDAQYGGRGEGFFQIVHSSAEARSVIEDGKAAVVLGIEISNLLNCKVNYAPLRSQEPFEETGEGPVGVENEYNDGMGGACTEETMVAELERIHGWGVRQIITIHEFDNAFGGNGIFDGLVLNLGNREDSGAIPGGALANPLLLADIDPANPMTQELPTGEFWTTYDCPIEGEDGFSGYLFTDEGGATLQSLPVCPYTGQGGRPGGASPCYPDRRQCNARWLTPRGLFVYSKMMEMGFIFDIDHLEMEMKTQGLELAEAQNPPYPFVSTHGTFGGTSIDQAQRMVRNGGFIYPSLGNGPQHIELMAEMRQVHADAGSNRLFGFGFGTDTNGLSAQSEPRTADQVAANGEIVYPYRLFDSGLFTAMPDFNGQNTADGMPVAGVEFQQPAVTDPDGIGRTWHLDADGSATFGMLSGMVQEINLHGTVEDMQDLFNSAEVFLQTWEATEAAHAGIMNNDNGGEVIVPDGVLRPAPVPDELGRGLGLPF